jgi:hypothetical protein
VTLAEHWNGTAWSIQATPANTGNDSDLVNVSCASASECVADGFSLPSVGKKAALVELWNGTEWKVQTTATLPKGDEQSWFDGISCPSAKDCIAVGGVVSTVEGIVPLIESWNGSKWTLQSAPGPGRLDRSTARRRVLLGCVEVHASRTVVEGTQQHRNARRADMGTVRLALR